MNPVNLITPTVLDVVTLSEAKDHLRVTVSDEDTLIQAYLKGAVERIEAYRQSNIMSAQYELYMSYWPSDDSTVNLQKNPVTAINSLKYYDADGTLQTLPASNYRLQDYKVPARLEFVSSFNSPDLDDREYPIIVNFQSGYLAASSVPAVLRSAIFLELGTMHEIRQSEAVGNGLTAVQMKNASMDMVDSETMWL